MMVCAVSTGGDEHVGIDPTEGTDRPGLKEIRKCSKRQMEAAKVLNLQDELRGFDAVINDRLPCAREMAKMWARIHMSMTVKESGSALLA